MAINAPGSDYLKLKISNMTEPEAPAHRIQSFVVYYYKPDGTIKNTETVVPVPFTVWADLVAFQERLLRQAVDVSTAIEGFLADPELLSAIRSIASILKVRGKSEPGIDLENLLVSGDYLQIGRIFLSQSYNDTGNENINSEYKPSLVAQIHHLDFGGKILRMSRELAAAQLEKAQEAELGRMGSPSVTHTQEQALATAAILPPTNSPSNSLPIVSKPTEPKIPLPLPIDSVLTTSSS